jgi:hypothetical protein
MFLVMILGQLNVYIWKKIYFGSQFQRFLPTIAGRLWREAAHISTVRKQTALPALVSVFLFPFY